MVAQMGMKRPGIRAAAVRVGGWEEGAGHWILEESRGTVEFVVQHDWGTPLASVGDWRG